jgi:uncharacterized protein (DUF427 family)
MRTPGPDHPIAIASSSARVVVRFAGRRIADSSRTLTLREAGYPPVRYIPREDVEMALLEPTDHATHCPYKGDASYFSLRVDGKTSDNAVWSYEAPYPSVATIGFYLAFYPDRVDAIEEIG